MPCYIRQKSLSRSSLPVVAFSIISLILKGLLVVLNVVSQIFEDAFRGFQVSCFTLIAPNTLQCSETQCGQKVAAVVLLYCSLTLVLLLSPSTEMHDAVIKIKAQLLTEPKSVLLLKEHFLIATKIREKPDHTDIVCIFHCVSLV